MRRLRFRTNEWEKRYIIKRRLNGGGRAFLLRCGFLEKKCHNPSGLFQSELETMNAGAPSSPPPDLSRREVFSGVVRDHHAALSAYATVIAGDPTRAAELVQDAFVTAWQNIGRFDVTRDIAAWLRGIVRNKWREACRSRNREIQLDEESLTRLENAVVEWQADRPEVFDRLAACREQLPAALGACVRCFYDDRLSGDVAARELGVSAATFRKRLERARALLRDCLSRKSNSTHP